MPTATQTRWTARGAATRRCAATLRSATGAPRALVARDGSIDWLCLPDLDSPSVFGAHARRGIEAARFALAPEAPYEVDAAIPARHQRARDDLHHRGGCDTRHRRDDAARDGLAPERELVRRVDGISGRVPMRWRVEPRFGLRRPPAPHRAPRRGPCRDRRRRCARRLPLGGRRARVRQGFRGGPLRGLEGDQALISLASAHGEPLVLPGRAEVERRLADTSAVLAILGGKQDLRRAHGERRCCAAPSC